MYESDKGWHSGRVGFLHNGIFLWAQYNFIKPFQSNKIMKKSPGHRASPTIIIHSFIIALQLNFTINHLNRTLDFVLFDLLMCCWILSAGASYT